MNRRYWDKRMMTHSACRFFPALFYWDQGSALSQIMPNQTLSCWMTLPKTMGRSGTPSGAPNQFQHRCAGHVGIGMYKPRDFTFVSVHSMPGLVSPNHPF